MPAEMSLFGEEQLLVPMRATDFARSLASGYLAGNVAEWEAEAGNSYSPDTVVGFRGALPAWSVKEVDGDPAIVLRVDATGQEAESNVPGCFFLPPLRRITSVASAAFAAEDAMKDFQATYLSFPDVPRGLVPLEVWEAPIETHNTDTLALEGLPMSREALSTAEMDAVAGWVRVLVEQFYRGGFDKAIPPIFSRASAGSDPRWSWERLATTTLEALDANAIHADRAIWSTLVGMLLEHRADRGFDRRGILRELEAKLAEAGAIDDAVRKWIKVAGDIFAARRDMTPLSDEGSIGQRAALAVLLAQTPEEVESLQVGKRVALLARTFSGGFQGLSRAKGDLKADRSQLDVVQEIAERLVRSEPSALGLGTRSFDSDLNSSDEVLLDGSVVGKRVSEPAPHRIMLRARAMEAGQRIVPEVGTGRLRIVSGEDGEKNVYVDDEPGSIKAHPLVRFWTPLVKVTSRTPSAAKVKEILAESWKRGCAVGITDVDGNSTLCCYVVVLTNTLDREEFEHHVAELRKFAKGFTS
jgi:hypothetical protein